METKKNKAMGWIVFLSLIVFCLIGYTVYDFGFKEKQDKTDTKGNKTLNDYIKVATYDTSVSQNSYQTVWGDTYYVENYKAPYIHIDSTDAENANRKIKSLFEEAMRVFEEGIQDSVSYIDTFKYQSYLNGDILSLVLEVSYGGTGVPVKNYYTYNFDIQTGKKVNYETVYKSVGYKEDNIFTNATNAIERAFDRWYQENITEDDEVYHNQLKEETLRSYEADVASQSLGYYLDSSKKLNIIFQLWVPVDSGILYTKTIVE